jgi:hypothetical protein
VLTGGLALAAHFETVCSPACDVAAGIVGAIVKNPGLRPLWCGRSTWKPSCANATDGVERWWEDVVEHQLSDIDDPLAPLDASAAAMAAVRGGGATVGPRSARRAAP